MAKSDLLKEAIADAKAVREMALQSAKAALQEAFSPKIQSMLSQQIQAEEEEWDEEDGEEMEEAIGTSNIGSGDNVEPSNVASDDSTEEVDTDHVKDLKEEEEFEDDEEEFGDEEFEDDEEEFDVEDDLEGEEEDDLDLEAVIRELEDMDDEEMDVDDEMDSEVDFDDEEGEEEEELDLEALFSEEDEEEMDDEEELDVAMDDDDEELDIDIEEEDDMDYEDDDEEFDDEEGEEEELDLEGLVNSLELESYVNRLESENKKLRGSLKEHRDVVKFLKDRINEVNVLNAKLLYTNKIFRNFNLDNNSRMKVLENFDRAKSIREIKLVYTTIAENLNSGRKSVVKENKSNRRRARRISEGASKPTRTTRPAKEQIVEQPDSQVSRIQKLAGIVKK